MVFIAPGTTPRRRRGVGRATTMVHGLPVIYENISPASWGHTVDRGVFAARCAHNTIHRGCRDGAGVGTGQGVGGRYAAQALEWVRRPWSERGGASASRGSLGWAHSRLPNLRIRE